MQSWEGGEYGIYSNSGVQGSDKPQAHTRNAEL